MMSCATKYMVRLFSVCYKDVAGEVGMANWQEAKDR